MWRCLKTDWVKWHKMKKTDKIGDMASKDDKVGQCEAGYGQL